MTRAKKMGWLAMIAAAVMLAPGAAALETGAGQQLDGEVPVTRAYTVTVQGARKNHRTTRGLENPEQVTCPYCGAETTDITRTYTVADGSAERPCDGYPYGVDIEYRYIDCYQAVCHDCPSVGNHSDSVLKDQTFAFNQQRTLRFCEGRSRI